MNGPGKPNGPAEDGARLREMRMKFFGKGDAVTQTVEEPQPQLPAHGACYNIHIDVSKMEDLNELRKLLPHKNIVRQSDPVPTKALAPAQSPSASQQDSGELPNVNAIYTAKMSSSANMGEPMQDTAPPRSFVATPSSGASQQDSGELPNINAIYTAKMSSSANMGEPIQYTAPPRSFVATPSSGRTALEKYHQLPTASRNVKMDDDDDDDFPKVLEESQIFLNNRKRRATATSTSASRDCGLCDDQAPALVVRPKKQGSHVSLCDKCKYIGSMGFLEKCGHRFCLACLGMPRTAGARLVCPLSACMSGLSKWTAINKSS